MGTIRKEAAAAGFGGGNRFDPNQSREAKSMHGHIQRNQ